MCLSLYLAWDYADLDVDLQLKLAPLWVAKNGLNHHCDFDLKLMLAPHQRVANTLECYRIKMWFATPCGGERTLWNDDGKVVLTCEDVCGLVDWTAAGALPRNPRSNCLGDFATAHGTLVFDLLRFASTRHRAMLIKLVYTVDITWDRNSTSRQQQTHRDEDNIVQTQEQTGPNC